MTWLLAGTERKHFSPLVSQARTLLSSLPKSRHWEVVVQTCCLVSLGWSFVTSEIKGKTSHEWGKSSANIMIVERQEDLHRWHSELHWASPTPVPMSDGAAGFPHPCLSERGMCWITACSPNPPLPWHKAVAASPAAGSCSQCQMCFPCSPASPRTEGHCGAGGPWLCRASSPSALLRLPGDGRGQGQGGNLVQRGSDGKMGGNASSDTSASQGMQVTKSEGGGNALRKIKEWCETAKAGNERREIFESKKQAKHANSD